MSDEEYFRDLMQAVDVPPTNADIGLAVVTGRRQARRGTMLAGAAAVLVVAGGTAYAIGAGSPGRSGDPQVGQARPKEATLADCTVELIGSAPSGTAVVDPAGRTVVGTVAGAVVRVDSGRTVPYPGATGEVVAVNNTGLIIGYDQIDQAGNQLAWTYRNGTKTMLPELAGYSSSFPKAVNARGDVVGAAMREGTDDTVPVIWPAEQPGTVRALQMPAGYGEVGTGSSMAMGITDDGVVAGNVRGAPARWAADGTPRLLEMTAGLQHGGISVVRGGDAYGWASVTGQNRTVAVRWSLLLDSDHQVEPGDVRAGVPEDIAGATPDGWLVTAGGEDHQPALVNPQRTVQRLPLPAAVQPPAGPGASASSISDDGRTITGATASPDRRLLIWHC